MVLVVILTATPLLQAASVPDAPEPCPMAEAAPMDGPCFTAPCPCDHSTPDALAPAPAAPARMAPGAPDLRRNAAGRVRCVPADGRLRAGHPFPIDHPPSARA